MRKAMVKVNNTEAAILSEIIYGKSYEIAYFPEYDGHPISLTMPLKQKIYSFDVFPPFFLMVYYQRACN